MTHIASGHSSSSLTFPKTTLRWSAERVSDLRDIALSCPLDYFNCPNPSERLVELLDRVTTNDEKRPEALAFLILCLRQRWSFHDLTSTLDVTVSKALPSLCALISEDENLPTSLRSLVSVTLHHESLIDEYQRATSGVTEALIISGSVAYGKFFSLRPPRDSLPGSDIDLFSVVPPNIALKNLVPINWAVVHSSGLHLEDPIPEDLDGGTLQLLSPDKTEVTVNAITSVGFARLCAINLSTEGSLSWAFPKAFDKETVRHLDGVKTICDLSRRECVGPHGNIMNIHRIPTVVRRPNTDNDIRAVALGGVVFSIAPFFDVRSTDEATLAQINRLRTTLTNLELECIKTNTDLLRSHVRYQRISEPIRLERLTVSRVIYPDSKHPFRI